MTIEMYVEPQDILNDASVVEFLRDKDQEVIEQMRGTLRLRSLSLLSTPRKVRVNLTLKEFAAVGIFLKGDLGL